MITTSNEWTNIVSDKELVAAKKLRNKSFVISKERSLALSELREEGWELHREYKDPKFVGVKKEKPFDERFEDKVWMLFANMGFTEMNRDRNFQLIYDNNPNCTQQIDVFAADDEGFEFDIPIFLTYTNYDGYPYTGMTLGIGFGVKYTIVPRFFAPGINISIAGHPMTAIKVLGFFADDESTDASSGTNNSNWASDYPARGDYTFRIYNDFSLTGVILRPFFGGMWLTFNNEEGFSDSTKKWIVGTELIIPSSYIGLEVARILFPEGTPATRYSFKLHF